MFDIRTRLSRAEDDLLLASSSGSLEEFENEWSRISYEIILATKEKRLPEDIQKLARVVSTRIYAIASSFLDLNTISRNFTTSFLDRAIPKETPPHGQNPVPTKQAIPPYIPLAYAWLIDNLHCPYPTTSMRTSLAEKSGSFRKAIDAWFIDVRKRIGWNALRRTRFGGKKDEIIRAATSFYCENKSDDSTGLEFASIEAAARDLYADKLRPSALVSRLAEDGKRLRSSKTDDSAPVLSRHHTTHHSPSSSSSPYPTTPSSKRTRSFDEFERETLDLTHSCQRPSKRKRLTSKSSSPVSSSELRSSSLSQSSSDSFSESHSLRPQTSQWSTSVSDSSPSHQVSKPANSAQEASTAVKCRTSPSHRPKSSMIHCENRYNVLISLSSRGPTRINSSFEAQLSREDDISSLSGVFQQGRHRRCISEVRTQLPSRPKNNPPRLQSASGSVFGGTSGVSNLPCNPDIMQTDSVFGSWDSTTECDVATFDFSTWSPESLNQAELSLPLQVPSSSQMGFPPPSIPSNAFIAPPSSDGISSLSSMGSFSNELIEMLDFFPQNPSEAGLAFFPTVPPHETAPFNAGLDSHFNNDTTDTAGPFGWDVPDGVQDYLTPLALQFATVSEFESATNLSEDDKVKKLKLLEEVKEFAHRLEAEIAVM